MTDLLYIAAIVLCGAGIFYFGMRHERSMSRLRLPSTRRQFDRVARRNRPSLRLVQGDRRNWIPRSIDEYDTEPTENHDEPPRAA